MNTKEEGLLDEAFREFEKMRNISKLNPQSEIHKNFEILGASMFIHWLKSKIEADNVFLKEMIIQKTKEWSEADLDESNMIADEIRGLKGQIIQNNILLSGSNEPSALSPKAKVLGVEK